MHRMKFGGIYSFMLTLILLFLDAICSMDNIYSAGSPPLKSYEPDNLSNKFAAPEELDKQSVSFAATPMSSEGYKTWLFSNTIEDAVVGPDTPGTKPLVPRSKRVQEDVFELEGRADGSVMDNGKRIRLTEVTDVPKKNHEESSETYSKFEWLHPSHVRDANGRKPGDPCYDKKTLYIPPDALRKMSASQRQYWDVKCQYMDVVLFFKVVSEITMLCSHQIYGHEINLFIIG